MDLSTINLMDPNSVRFDDSGRSAAYFCRKTAVQVSFALISELKEVASQLGDKNVRICLHDGPDAPFHEMVNLEHRGRYYRPHKHPSKGESYHIIEGSMGLFIFDENGSVTDANILDPQSRFLYRVGRDTYHTLIPLTELLIYHEAKLGPFLRQGDSIFAPWSPDGDDIETAMQYTKGLLQNLDDESLGDAVHYSLT